MLGAIIGDIIGSRWEFNPTNDYNFELFSDKNGFTDDTICTIGVADALLHDEDFGKYIHKWCRKYHNPMGGYGGSFAKWVASKDPQPYNSYGNGAAMRVSPIAWAHLNCGSGIDQAGRSAKCSHNHPEGIKGAQTTYLAVHHAIEFWHCNTLPTKENIKKYIIDRCVEFSGYDVNIKSKEVQNKFDETCRGTVPVALWIIGQSSSFEDAIRKAVCLGADADTLGAIVGGIAEPLWGIPRWMYEKAMEYLPKDMKDVIQWFEENYDSRVLPVEEGNTISSEKDDPMDVLLLWKLGLGNMAKYFNGEDPMPSKNTPPSSSRISNIKAMSEHVDEFTRITNVPIVVPNGAMHILRRGHIPESQEDHWFMFCTCDTLFYYRSWTGECAFECKFKKLNSENFILYVINVNRNLSQLGVTGELSALLLLQYLLIAETGGNWLPAWNAFASNRHNFDHIAIDDFDSTEKSRPTGLDLKDKIRGCLIGGAIGDALGSQVKGLSWKEIEKKYGRFGVRRYDTSISHYARISDDTQLAMYTAGGLLHFGTQCVFNEESPVDAYKFVIKSYDDWCDNQMQYRHSNPTCWFDEISYLNETRNPGKTNFGMLCAIHDNRKPALHSWGSTGVTRIAPLALYHSSLNNKNPNSIDVMNGAAMAGHLAWITHRHPFGWLPACALHFILSFILEGNSVRDAVRAAISTMKDFCDQNARVERVGSEIEDHEEYFDCKIKLIEKLETAYRLGKDNVKKDEAYKQLGKGYSGAEALSIAIYCCVRYSDPMNIRTNYVDTGESTPETTLRKHMFEEALCCAVNHSGNTDATGTLVGQIMGAWAGYVSIPGYYKGDPYSKDPVFESREEHCELEGYHELMILAEDIYKGCPFTHKPNPKDIETKNERIWYLRYVLSKVCDSSDVNYVWDKYII